MVWHLCGAAGAGVRIRKTCARGQSRRCCGEEWGWSGGRWKGEEVEESEAGCEKLEGDGDGEGDSEDDGRGNGLSEGDGWNGGRRSGPLGTGSQTAGGRLGRRQIQGASIS